MAQIVPYAEKQQSWQWRLGKTPAFDLELDTRFPWGGVQLLLTLKEGRVESVDAFSDALDADLSEELKTRLTGCRFGSAPLHDALMVSPKEQIRDVAQFILTENL